MKPMDHSGIQKNAAGAFGRDFQELGELNADMYSILHTAQGFFFYRVAVERGDLSKSRVILVSPSITDVAGITDPYDFESWFAAFHPDDKPGIIEANRRSVVSGTPYDQVARWFHQQRQEWIWVRTIAQPVFDDQGELTHFNGLCLDVTAHKKADEALKESELRFRSLIEGAPEAVFVQSGGLFRYLNPAMCKLFGISVAEEFLGTEIFARIAPEYHDIVRKRIREQRESGEPAPRMAMEYLRLDGTRIFVETSAVPIAYRDHDAHLVFVQDITGRKQQDAEAKRRNDELHKINTKLENSQKRLQKLSEQLLSAQEEEQRRIAAELHDGIGQYLCGLKLRVDDLVQRAERRILIPASDMRAVSELAAHMVDDIRRLVANLRPAILDNTSLEKAVEWLCAQFAGAGVSLKTDIDPVDKDLSETRRLAIFRVIQEALANAIRHSGATVVRVSMKWTGGGGVRISVGDNGRGFDSADTQGSGFGLLSMQDRVGASGGELIIVSAVGEGTTLTAEWPPASPAIA